MTQRLRIILAQLNPLVGDIAGNAAKIIAAAERARDEFNADLILFPELCLTGYPPEDLLLRPGLYRRVATAMKQLQDIRGIALVVGYPEKTTQGVFNSAALIADGKIQANYRKQSLPNYSVFDEKRYFEACTESCVIDFKGVPVALSICEDMWHPGVMAQAKNRGAKLMLNLNASPFHLNKGFEREATMRQRLQEGAIPIVYCNQIGGQDELVFDGESFVMDADGAVVMRGQAFVEALYPVDFEIGAQVIAVPGVIHAPMSEEASVYQAIVLGVRDYIEKNGFSGVVIGLSGGVDSALTLAIAVDAIGADRVEGVRMPSRFTAEMSLEDAMVEAKALGVECHTISIEQAFQSFLSMLQEEFAEFSGRPWDTTEENIQARCRGILLMAISNKKRKIVLTTGNKSEMAVGYATLYGDMAGGYAPIKDVPKTLVYRLARYRNCISPVIPDRVLERPPSAELAPNQKDEDSLPPYDILDPIIEMYIEKDMCAEDIIAAGYDEAMVDRVVQLVNRNEYKRRQAPPGVRISRRAFGRDRRYPITSAYK
ncbi:MAG: NAD+ synthase [Gammaproteobacteria bacterium]|nr:NAD+ synthase [Gammaproteobacteria bacterium]